MSDGQPRPQPGASRASLRLVLLAASLGALVFGCHHLGIDPVSLTQQALHHVEHSLTPTQGSVAMVALIALTTPLMVSCTPMNLAAGAMWGVVWGSVVVLVGCAVGAVLNFVVARWFAREWTLRQIASNKVFSSLNRALASDATAFKIIALARLSPVFPFALLSFLFGVSDVGVWRFASATLVGLVPGVVVYAYLGVGMRTLASNTDQGPDYALLTTIALSLLSIVVISRQAQHVLNDATKQS